jgi:hypothetical protein
MFFIAVILNEHKVIKKTYVIITGTPGFKKRLKVPFSFQLKTGRSICFDLFR